MSQKSTILVVDDEEIIRDVTQGLLAGEGYHLAFAENGIEALVKAKELTPDLILLDVMMPKMDGFEACRRIRSDPLLAEVPIIMITALDDRQSRLEGIKAGADDFLSKPFDMVELKARVRTITRLNRYRRLLMERNKFEWVVNQTKDGYLMLDEDGQILYTNPQARLYLGLTPDDAYSFAETFLECVNKLYQCEPQAAWDSWPNPLEVTSPRYLVRPESSTAESFWLQVDLMDMSSLLNGGYLVRLLDITATIKSQRLMWTFHEQVSHKLRTPLTKLTGFLRILKEDQKTLSEADQVIILSTADNSAQLLQEEILSIFQYLDSLENVNFTSNVCSLTQVPAIVAEIKDNLELELVDVTTENSTGLEPVNIPLPHRTIELLLSEVLLNAKKFHPTQSPAIQVKLAHDTDHVYISIFDSGLTLSPEQLENMWLPYYQAEKYFSGQVPGMGLGLSMVASLIWSIGGSGRSYNREDGPGIVVELILPLATS